MTPAQWALEQIAPIVEAECHVGRAELLGRGRTRTVAKARLWLYWAMREHGLSYPEIGGTLDRDHQTIINGVRVINAQVDGSIDAWERSERIREAMEGIVV